MSFAHLQQGSSKGRPSLYQGESPGVGGGSSGGGFPFGSMNPTRVVNQTLGMQTNHTINYAYILRKFKSGFDQDLHQGQLIFIKKSGPPMGQRMYTVMNLVQINYFMARKQAESVFVPPAGANADAIALAKVNFEKKLLDDMNNMFVPLGIMQGDAGVVTAGRAQERLINVTVSGRVRAFNIWGNECPDGTPLYVVLKKKQFPTNLTDFSVSNEPVPTPAGGIYQYVPYACDDHTEPGEEDENGNWVSWQGKAYYVGRVSHNSRFKSTTPGHVLKAQTSHERMATLPMLEIFVDYALTE